MPYRVMIIRNRPEYKCIRNPKVKKFRGRESFVLWLERRAKKNSRLDFILDYSGFSPNFWRGEKHFVDVVLRIRDSAMVREVEGEALEMVSRISRSMT